MNICVQNHRLRIGCDKRKSTDSA